MLRGTHWAACLLLVLGCDGAASGTKPKPRGTEDAPATVPQAAAAATQEPGPGSAPEKALAAAPEAAPAAAPAAASEVASALERGLAWLDDRQQQDGSWLCGVRDDYTASKVETPHVGVTALAGLALQRGGSDDVAVRAADYLARLGAQSLYGYITAHGSRLIEHALAIRFLAEHQAKHPQPAIEEVLWRGAGLLLRSQSPEGGWRYQPFPRDADMSCTAPAFDALLAARAAGFEVPETTFTAARAYAARCCRKNSGGVFSYQDLPTHQAHASFGCTAAGVFVLLSGENAPRAILEATRGVAHLEEQGRDYAFGRYHYFYCHYYALQALDLAGSAKRLPYRDHLRDTILAAQKGDGTWQDDVGETYATAMACLLLQMLR